MNICCLRFFRLRVNISGPISEGFHLAHIEHDWPAHLEVLAKIAIDWIKFEIRAQFVDEEGDINRANWILFVSPDATLAEVSEMIAGKIKMLVVSTIQ